MTGLSEIDNRQIAELTKQMERLTAANAQGQVSTPKQGRTSIFVEQATHGFSRGDAVYKYFDGTWQKSPAYYFKGAAVSFIWGIVEYARTNSFQVVTHGRAIVNVSLSPGEFYTFLDGVPTLLTGDITRQYGAALLTVQAMDDTSVFVQGNPPGLTQYGVDTLYYNVTVPAGAVVGDFVALDDDFDIKLAVADQATPSLGNVVGCLVFKFTSTNFLMAMEGYVEIHETGVDLSGNWPDVTGMVARYLSTTLPGKTTNDRPEYAILVCYGTMYYHASEEEGDEEYSSAFLRLAGPGRTPPISLPLSLEDGGTGADISGIFDNAILSISTFGADRHFIGYINAAADIGFLSQQSGGPATWTYPDTNIFQIASGFLKLKDGSTLGQFLRWSGSAWQIYGPLLTVKGNMLTFDGTDLAQVAAGTALSVLGNPTAVADVPVPITSTAAMQILYSTATTIGWLSAPTADGMVLRRAAGVIGWGVVSGLPTVTSADEGKVLWVNSSGAWVATRDEVLGKGALTATSTQGSLGVVKSNDGDYIKLSSSGIEIYDRSIDATTPLIKIDIGHASLTSSARQIAIREFYVCDPSSGTVKQCMIPASPAY